MITLREHELPGVPVVDADGHCVGIVTEADLVLPDDQGDLHIPHYINLFGGTVFLESLEPLRGAAPQGVRLHRGGHDDPRSPTRSRPDASVKRGGRLIHETGHNRLPVVEDGRLVGVVTRLDVLGALTGVSVS